MELSYYLDKKGNFGDDLNPWLWDRILPGLMGTRDDIVLVGMGTILENWFAKRLAPDKRKLVLGSGGGMTLPVLATDDTWTFYGVRGPLTARYLGLEPDRALTDPAMCIGRWIEAPTQRRGVGFMPHHHSLARWDWPAVCAQAGLVYLDPHADPLETLHRINGLEKVIAEAMHTAIVADALRIPWVPLRINQWNYVAKWDDWASTLGLPVHFRIVPELHDPVFGKDAVTRMSWRLRAMAGRQTPASPRRVVNFVRRELMRMAESDDGQLSTDAVLGDVVDRFLERAGQLRSDIAPG